MVRPAFTSESVGRVSSQINQALFVVLVIHYRSIDFAEVTPDQNVITLPLPPQVNFPIKPLGPLLNHSLARSRVIIPSNPVIVPLPTKQTQDIVWRFEKVADELEGIEVRVFGSNLNQSPSQPLPKVNRTVYLVLCSVPIAALHPHCPEEWQYDFLQWPHLSIEDHLIGCTLQKGEGNDVVLFGVQTWFGATFGFSHLASHIG